MSRNERSVTYGACPMCATRHLCTGCELRVRSGSWCIRGSNGTVPSRLDECSPSRVISRFHRNLAQAWWAGAEWRSPVEARGGHSAWDFVRRTLTDRRASGWNNCISNVFVRCAVGLTGTGGAAQRLRQGSAQPQFCANRQRALPKSSWKQHGTPFHKPNIPSPA